MSGRDDSLEWSWILGLQNTNHLMPLTITSCTEQVDSFSVFSPLRAEDDTDFRDDVKLWKILKTTKLIWSSEVLLVAKYKKQIFKSEIWEFLTYCVKGKPYGEISCLGRKLFIGLRKKVFFWEISWHVGASSALMNYSRGFPYIRMTGGNNDNRVIFHNC